MRLTPTVLEAIAGGALAGSAVGLAELAWLYFAGAPFDGPIGAWAWGLYGLAGALPAAVAGIGLGLLAARRPSLGPLAFGLGAVVGFVPLWLVVAPYVLNRDLFAERGLPWWAWALVAALALLPSPILAGGWRRAVSPSPRALRPALGLLAPWALIAVLLVIGPLLQPPPAPKPEPTPGPAGPGVLVIVVDTLRADAVEDPPEPLPTLGALRSRSVAFPQAWSQASWTRPAFATLFTSRLPSGHRTSTKGSRLPDDLPTIGQVLASGGVPSLAVVNNPNVTASYGFERGFSRFVHLAPAYPFGATEAVFGLSLYKVLHRVHARLPLAPRVEHAYRPAAQVLDRALPFLRANRGRAHLAVVHLMEPHDPYFSRDASGRVTDGFARARHPSPDPARASELRALYDGEVRHLDAQLGAFFETLRAEGLDDGLAIVLTSDHGEEFFERGGWWHGDSLHREQTQVPLWIRLPDGALAGTEAPFTASLLDVAPTIAALLGVPAHPAWEGRDLLGEAERRALGGGSSAGDTDDEPPASAGAADPDPDVASSESAATRRSPAGDSAASEGDRCLASRRHPLDRPIVQEEDFAGNRLAALRFEGFAWLRAEPDGPRAWPERALFDTLEDPDARRDLLGVERAPCELAPAAVAADLDAALERLRAASASNAPEPAAAGALSEAERQRLCALGYLSEGCP